jgi:prolyl-tRNA editing enzyme YbaK/EbsC (Cys-tRNA(Pro) deacylase)
MQFGTLTFTPAADNPELVAEPIQVRLRAGDFVEGILVSAIDPALADTAAFCEAYGIDPESGANCIIVEAKRADRVWYAACVILASDMIDVNNKVRRHLDARKISFAPREAALKLTGMEYGGVTPLGSPEDLPILVDKKVLEQPHVIIGSGLRGSKILARSSVLAGLPQATVIDITK